MEGVARRALAALSVEASSRDGEFIARAFRKVGYLPLDAPAPSGSARVSSARGRVRGRGAGCGMSTMQKRWYKGLAAGIGDARALLIKNGIHHARGFHDGV